MTMKMRKSTFVVSFICQHLVIFQNITNSNNILMLEYSKLQQMDCYYIQNA